jgi:hypothetical protein
LEKELKELEDELATPQSTQALKDAIKVRHDNVKKQKLTPTEITLAGIPVVLTDKTPRKEYVIPSVDELSTAIVPPATVTAAAASNGTGEHAAAAAVPNATVPSAAGTMPATTSDGSKPSVSAVDDDEADEDIVVAAPPPIKAKPKAKVRFNRFSYDDCRWGCWACATLHPTVLK